jgi:hypothetical protein
MGQFLLSSLPLVSVVLSRFRSNFHLHKQDDITLAGLHRCKVSEIQQAMAMSLYGFESAQANLVREEIFVTQDVRDLWLLRSKLHQLLAQKASQDEAAYAINALLPYFSGWLPERQLIEI